MLVTHMLSLIRVRLRRSSHQMHLPLPYVRNARPHDSWGFSQLDKCTARNVKDLVPLWSASTGTPEGHQAPPIVNDGTMFVTTPFNQVLAFDAATGDLLWRYRRQMPPDIRMGHP